ncbi:MAG: NAD-dependent epimerase/dehydratase family protein, partial [Sphingobacteriales bacterium]
MIKTFCSDYRNRQMADFKQILKNSEHTWLLTGVAGFIGSHILEALLEAGQKVIGIDNFFTGKFANIEEVRQRTEASKWQNFNFIEGDIRDYALLEKHSLGCDFVVHQAALGSVPLSIENPLLTHEVNDLGTLNVLRAAVSSNVKRVVFATSCAVYGDNPNLPLGEGSEARPLSPYAASKLCNEIYASTFSNSYGLSTVGLRYFNVYGPRQDPKGAYAAVIPKWINAGLDSESISIFGDGNQTRDFVYVKDIVSANINAALSKAIVGHKIINVASGLTISLNDLKKSISEAIFKPGIEFEVKFLPER